MMVMRAPARFSADIANVSSGPVTSGQFAGQNARLRRQPLFHGFRLLVGHVAGQVEIHDQQGNGDEQESAQQYLAENGIAEFHEDRRMRSGPAYRYRSALKNSLNVW